MTSTLRSALYGAVAVAALAVASAMPASATTIINGGGSSLIAPTLQTEFGLYKAYNPNAQFNYASVGSGAGQAAFLNNDATQFGQPGGTTVHFSASDAFLSQIQLSAYASGLALKDGPLIQLPSVGTPITIPFNNISGGVTSVSLTDRQACLLFSGLLTDWHLLYSQAPKGSTIQVFYRLDGSGTSFLLTQHLAAVCTAADTPANFKFSATFHFNALFPNSTPPANFHGATNSKGVQQGILSTANATGYLSPDYTSLAPTSPNTSNLKVASVVNGTTRTAYQPNYANTVAALGTAPAPSNPADQTQWVPTIPNPPAGYPIVGYTTLEFSQCYLNANVAANIHAFLADFYGITNPPKFKEAEIANDFVPIPASFTNAVYENFLTNTSGLRLDFNDPVACKGKGR